MRSVLIHHLSTTVACLCLLLSMAGCADLTEVDDMNIVVALGIDETPDGQVRATAEIAHLAGGTTGQRAQPPSDQSGESIVRESVGKTAEDAISKFETTIPHRLYLANNTVVVFGMTYAKTGVNRTMDYLERDRHFRRNQLMVVTNGTARNLLKANPEPMTYRSQAIRKLVEQSSTQLKSVNSEQLAFLRDYLNPPNTAIMARVDKTSDNRLTNAGVGLFDHGNLVEFLEPQQTQFMSLLLGKRGVMTITVVCPEAKQSDIGMTFRTVNNSVHIVPKYAGNRIHLVVQIRGNAEVLRLCPNQKMNSETVSQLERVLDKAVEDDCRELMDNLKSNQIDAIKIGNLVYRKNPGLWSHVADRWKRDTFASLDETFDVRFNLLRGGLATNSPLGIFDSRSMTPRDGYEERIQ